MFDSVISLQSTVDCYELGRRAADWFGADEPGGIFERTRAAVLAFSMNRIWHRLIMGLLLVAVLVLIWRLLDPA